MSNDTNNTTSQSTAPVSTGNSVQASPESAVSIQASPSAETKPSSPLAQIQTAPPKMHLEFSQNQPKNQETQSPEAASGDKEE